MKATDKHGNPVLRHIPYDELHLMMERLVLKVQQEPKWFEDWENGKLQKGVTNFIQGEDHRRNLSQYYDMSERQMDAEVSLNNINKLVESMHEDGDIPDLAKSFLKDGIDHMILQVQNMSLPYKEIEK